MLGAATFVTKQFISLAIALMRKVFPHPEGPYNKMPLGNVSPVNGKKKLMKHQKHFHTLNQN